MNNQSTARVYRSLQPNTLATRKMDTLADACPQVVFTQSPCPATTRARKLVTRADFTTKMKELLLTSGSESAFIEAWGGAGDLTINIKESSSRSNSSRQTGSVHLSNLGFGFRV